MKTGQHGGHGGLLYNLSNWFDVRENLFSILLHIQRQSHVLIIFKWNENLFSTFSVINHHRAFDFIPIDMNLLHIFDRKSSEKSGGRKFLWKFMAFKAV